MKLINLWHEWKYEDMRSGRDLLGYLRAGAIGALVGVLGFLCARSGG